MSGLKAKLGCRFGFHRYGPWEWFPARGDEAGWEGPMQRRLCQDCPKRQPKRGGLVSSEERRYYEGWRDR